MGAAFPTVPTQINPWVASRTSSQMHQCSLPPTGGSLDVRCLLIFICHQRHIVVYLYSYLQSAKLLTITIFQQNMTNTSNHYVCPQL